MRKPRLSPGDRIRASVCENLLDRCYGKAWQGIALGSLDGGGGDKAEAGLTALLIAAQRENVLDLRAAAVPAPPPAAPEREPAPQEPAIATDEHEAPVETKPAPAPAPKKPKPPTPGDLAKALGYRPRVTGTDSHETIIENGRVVYIAKAPQSGPEVVTLTRQPGSTGVRRA